MGVPRGTTPTFVLTFPEASGIDLTQAINMYVTFRSGSKTITKTGDDLSISPLSVSVFLTQSETLSFNDGPVEIQANWTLGGNKRAASEVARYTFTKQLLQKVIE